MYAELRHRGRVVNRMRVERLMRAHDLVGEPAQAGAHHGPFRAAGTRPGPARA
ncbi:IS3 family transposase [Salinifilum ghardaiensis]